MQIYPTNEFHHFSPSTESNSYAGKMDQTWSSLIAQYLQNLWAACLFKRSLIDDDKMWTLDLYLSKQWFWAAVYLQYAEFSSKQSNLDKSEH